MFINIINCENSIKENKSLKIRIKENKTIFIFLIISLLSFIIFAIIMIHNEIKKTAIDHSIINKFEGSYILLFLSLSAIFPFSIFFLVYIKKVFITYIILGFLVVFSILFNFDSSEEFHMRDFYTHFNLFIKIITILNVILSIITCICLIVAIFYLGTNKFKVFSWIFLILGIPNLIFLLICFLVRIYFLKKNIANTSIKTEEKTIQNVKVEN